MLIYTEFGFLVYLSRYVALAFLISLYPLQGFSQQVDYEDVVVTNSSPQEFVFQIKKGPYTESQKDILLTLELSHREEFESKRRFVLEQLARILNSNKSPLGLFGYTAQSLQNKHYSYAFDNEYTTLNLKDYKVESVVLDTRLKTRSELKKKSINAALEFANSQLYDNASVLIQANEFGLEFVMGKIGGLSKGKLGFMPGVGVGVRLGFSWSERAVLASVFGVYENFSSPVSPFNILFGDYYKLGPYMGLSSKERVFQNGRGFAPPMGPVESNSYGDSSSFTLLFNYTLPLPTPLDGFVSYTKNLKMVHLARLIIPVPGQGAYPKIKSVFFDLNVMKQIFSNLVSSTKKMAERLKSHSANSCYQIITN